MKSILFTVGALVATIMAQELADLPQCGQTCVNNMLGSGKADELGCDANDIGCLCLNPNFIYGVRDCSLAICSGEEAQQIVGYGISLCSGAGVAITTAGGSASATRTASSGPGSGSDSSVVVSGSVSTIYSTFTSDGETGSTAVATTTIIGSDGEDISSAAGGFITTVTSDGSAIVQTITSEAADAASSAAGAASSAASEAGSALSSAGSIASSIASSIGSDISSVASEASASASDALGSASSEITSVIGSITSGAPSETSESDGAAVPRMTAAPMGMIAAAGVAALFL